MADSAWDESYHVAHSDPLDITPRHGKITNIGNGGRRFSAGLKPSEQRLTLRRSDGNMWTWDGAKWTMEETDYGSSNKS